ncbi:MAG: hypothetical protein ABI408_09020 [Gemmatimonadaceae bacterium]
MTQEFPGEPKTIPENGSEDVHVLSGRYASEQNHFAVRVDLHGQLGGVALQGSAVAELAGLDWNVSIAAQILEPDHERG